MHFFMQKYKKSFDLWRHLMEFESMWSLSSCQMIMPVKTERGNWKATVSREVFFRLFLVRRRLRTRDLKNRFTSASVSSSWSKPWKWKDCCFSSWDSFQLLFMKETLVSSLSCTQLSWYLLLKNSIPKGATQDTLMLLNQQVLVCISTRLIFFCEIFDHSSLRNKGEA